VLPDDHAIAVLNVSHWRCDTLLITRDGTTAIPLPELARDNVTARARA